MTIRVEHRDRPRRRAGLLAAASTLALVGVAFAPDDAIAQAGSRLVSTQAATPTFSRDVAPILQQKCQQCHTPGGLGPMALTTYQEARPWAAVIRDRVTKRIMPPWHLDKTIGIQAYKNDISLSDEEIATIAAWVDAGAPEGDRADLPPAIQRRQLAEGAWELEEYLGPPDLVFETGPIPIRAEGQDFWPSIDVDWEGVDKPRFLRGTEIRNSNQGRSALHHNNVVLRIADGPSGRIVGAGAGKNWDLFAPDTGIRVDPGKGILNFGLHYFPIGVEFEDNVEVALWFYPEDKPPLYESTSEYHQLIDQFTPGEPRARDVLIPPHGKQTLTRVVVLTEPIMINSIRPHMHLHGIAQSIEVVWPLRLRDYTGHPSSPAEVIASVNNYDHNWQISYSFEDHSRPLLPAGAVLMYRTHFDNTESNPLSIDPDQWVAFGGRSVDAMSHMHMAISYLDQEQYETILAERKKIAEAQVSKPESARIPVWLPYMERPENMPN